MLKTIFSIVIALIVFSLLSLSAVKAAEDEPLSQWALNAINLPVTYHLTRGDGAKIAVIDTGIMPHYEYNQSYAQGYVAPGLSTEVANPHGTYVAGIISSQHRLQGVAPQAALYSMKVFHVYYSDQSLSWGINQAVDIGVDVISMSVGSVSIEYDNYPLIKAAIKRAIDNNIIVVIAAGNEGCNCPKLLTSFNGVVSVGATNSEGQVSYFSNYGDWVDIYAPGSMVVTTLSPGDRYFPFTGTSAATPFVAGVAALAKSLDKTLTPARFKQLLAQTSTNKLLNAGKLLYTIKGSLFTYFIPLSTG